MILLVFILGLCFAFIYFVCKALWDVIRKHEYIREKMKDPQVRRWWLGHALILGVGVPLAVVIRETDLIFKGDELSWRRWSGFALIFSALLWAKSALHLEPEDRPESLDPAPVPFEKLRNVSFENWRPRLARWWRSL